MDLTWKEKFHGGGCMFRQEASSARSVWSGGGRYCILPSGRSLRLYIFRASDEVNDETRLLSRIRTLTGHTGMVTALADLGKYRCLSGSLDGTARLWDVSDGTTIRTIDLGLPVTDIASHETFDDRAYCAVGDEIRRIDVMKGKTEAVVDLRCDRIYVTPLNNRLVGVRRKTIYMFDGASGFDNNSCVSFVHLRGITAVAIHPTDGSIAVGDENGVVTIYHNALYNCDNHTDGQKEIKGVSIRQSQMHWHSGPVLSLIYTGEGSGLLSGGFEGVLVMWELTSGRRNFLPRLGGAIRSLSVNPVETIYTVTCGDNAVRFVSAMSFSLVAHVRGIRPIDAFQGPKKEMIGLSLVPDLNNPGVVFVAGLPSVLQLYDLWRDEHIADLPVNTRNVLLTYGNRATHGTSTKSKVRLACVSHDSQDLVTIDVLRGPRQKGNGFALETLRFWSRGDGSLNYRMVAKMDRPHDDSEVTSLVAHPSKAVVVSTASGGSFKVWRRRKDAKGELDWSCVYSGSYRDLSCNCASFSADGSLLGVGFDSVVALWFLNSEGVPSAVIRGSSGSDNRVLSHAARGEKITSIAFPGKVDSTLLATASANSLHVWNIITKSVWWSVRMQIFKLAADPLGNLIAADVLLGGIGSAKKGQEYHGIALFDISNPVPLKVFRIDGRIAAMTFIPTSDMESSCVLATVNDKLEVNTYAEDKALSAVQLETDHAAADAELPEEAELPVSGLGEVIDAKSVVGAEDQSFSRYEDDFVRWKISARRAMRTFDAPTHTLPPLTQTAPKFFSELLSDPRDTQDDDEEEEYRQTRNKSTFGDSATPKEKETVYNRQPISAKILPQRASNTSDKPEPYRDDFYTTQHLDSFVEFFQSG